VWQSACHGWGECLDGLKGFNCSFSTHCADGRTAAHAAAHNGHERCLEMVHREGCNVSQMAFDGATPACGAALNGHAGCLRILHKLGCDVGLPTKEGCCPAFLAARNGHEACLRALMELGFRISVTYKGKTSLQAARERDVRGSHRRVINMLAEDEALGAKAEDAAAFPTQAYSNLLIGTGPRLPAAMKKGAHHPNNTLS
jgi:ankyrin repeat protein